MTADTLGKVKQLDVTPSQRNFGVIVTASHRDGPPSVTFHMPGLAEDAVRAACARVDAMGEGWKIVAISTPRTIYRDMQGTRADHSARPKGGAQGGRRPARYDDCRPEIRQLSHVGRLDLLAPLGAKP